VAHPSSIWRARRCRASRYLGVPSRITPTDGRLVSRKPLIAGNWKMNCNHLEAIALVQKLAFTLRPADYQHVEVAVLPPFTALRSVQTLIDGDKMKIRYGAQDLSQHDSGAYTGDISGAFLAKLGCSYVLAGHSERRQYHGESDDVVNAKVKAALRWGLVPIVCVGESLADREEGRTQEVLSQQFLGGPASLTPEEFSRILLAYEPVWAIGTGRTATPEIAAAAHSFIRSCVHDQFSAELAASVRILYGGSVKPDNIPGLRAQPDLDGALVGGASLDAKSFAAIVNC